MDNLNFLKPVSVSNKIRIGRRGDGGYVVYKPSLDKIDVLMTYGVGWDVDFEIDFFNLTQKRVFMHDPTMFEDNYISKPHCKRLLKKWKFQSLYQYLQFSTKWKKHLEYLDSNGVKFVNEGIATQKGQKYDVLWNHLCRNEITDQAILLKMDIEGHEYAILESDDFDQCIPCIDQIIIEIHDLKNKLRRLKEIIEKLHAYFEIVHIHGNNHSEPFTLYTEKGDISFPDVIELTLVKRESIVPQDLLSENIDYPIDGLDYQNTPFKQPIRNLKFE